MKRITSIFFFAAFLGTLYLPTIFIVNRAMTHQHIEVDAFALARLLMLLLFMPIILKYIVHLLIAPWYAIIEKFRKRKKSRYKNFSVSVLIPAWNEEVGIQSTIESVLRTRYPRLEIIIVNDGSTDSTHHVITAFLKKYKQKKLVTPVPIRYKRIPNGGKARALNTALAMAKGDIVMTIDSDSIMDARAIKNIVRHFADERIASVAGNVIIGNRRKPIGLVQQLEYLYGFYFKRADSLLNAVYIVGGAAAAYRKAIIKNLGGFDESIITEDIELSTRLQDNGYLVKYAADAVVYTEGPSSFSGLCKQRLRWKFGRLVTFYKYRHLFFSLKKHHNMYLCFLILPIALFSEFLLFFEGILLTVFYTYTFYTNDFVPLVVFILLLASIISFQIVTDHKIRHHANLLLLAPGAWVLFYFMDIVEYQALMRSIWYLIKKKKPAWQRWVRLGVFKTT